MIIANNPRWNLVDYLNMFVEVPKFYHWRPNIVLFKEKLPIIGGNLKLVVVFVF